MRTLKNGTADGCIETNQLRKMTLDRKINRNETAIKKINREHASEHKKDVTYIRLKKKK